MLKKPTKHCNGMALVIDRPIMELLKIEADTPLEITSDGKRLIVAPAEPSARRERFEAAKKGAHERYGQAFKKLAE